MYFHFAPHDQVCHIPNMIRRHGNLIKYSMQALEHLHAINKWLRRNMGRPATASRDAMQHHQGLRALQYRQFFLNAGFEDDKLQKYEEWLQKKARRHTKQNK
jgi:hypothetical protein